MVESSMPADREPLQAVRVAEGVQFAAITGAEADDGISKDLLHGVYPPCFQPLFALLGRLARSGGRVLDLGAHVGSFALAAAAADFEVVAVEASPRNAHLLRKSRERNGFGDRLRVVHAGVSDRPGMLRFIAAGPFGHVLGPDDDRPGIAVPALAVDDLLADLGWDRVDFIKMDVEGSEVAAVRGMARLLARPDAPPILYESNGHTLAKFGHDPRDLRRALARAGYRNYRAEPDRLVPVGPGDLQPATVIDYLALKRQARWRVDRPARPEQLLTAALAAAESANPVDRAYIAGALNRAPHALRRRPEVINALARLRLDADAEVRRAAAAAPPARSWLGALQRLGWRNRR